MFTLIYAIMQSSAFYLSFFLFKSVLIYCPLSNLHASNLKGGGEKCYAKGHLTTNNIQINMNKIIVMRGKTIRKNNT